MKRLQSKLFQRFANRHPRTSSSITIITTSPQRVSNRLQNPQTLAQQRKYRTARNQLPA